MGAGAPGRTNFELSTGVAGPLERLPGTACVILPGVELSECLAEIHLAVKCADDRGPRTKCH
jgi:hypothetical protein